MDKALMLDINELCNRKTICKTKTASKTLKEKEPKVYFSSVAKTLCSSLALQTFVS